MMLTQAELDLLNDLETKCANHFNKICEGTVSYYNNNNIHNHRAMIIIGGRLLKYMTPPCKVLDNNYLEQRDENGRQLLKSFDTDVKLYILDDYLSTKPNRMYNPLEVINDLKDEIVDSFIEGNYIQGLYNVLDLRLYFIDIIFRQHGFKLATDLKSFTKQIF